VPLEAVPDKVFSSGAMGADLVVIPTVGETFAPVSGTLLMNRTTTSYRNVHVAAGGRHHPRYSERVLMHV
jgi:phosphotransferase system IIA component